MAQRATIPTTTPAAMAAVLDFGFGVADTEGVDWLAVWPGAVTTMVLALVITDVGPLVVGLGVVKAGVGELDVEVVEPGLELVLGPGTGLGLGPGLELALPLPLPPPTTFPVPVKYTDQVFAPPPKTKSVTRSTEINLH